MEVDSFHHQVIDKLGKGLKCSAHAVDGIKEAFESVGRNIIGRSSILRNCGSSTIGCMTS